MPIYQKHQIMFWISFDSEEKSWIFKKKTSLYSKKERKTGREKKSIDDYPMLFNWKSF